MTHTQQTPINNEALDDKNLPEELLMNDLKVEKNSLQPQNFEYNGKPVKRKPNKVRLKLLDEYKHQKELWLKVEAWNHNEWCLEWYLGEEEEPNFSLWSEGDKMPSPLIYINEKPFVLQTEVFKQFFQNLKQNGYAKEWIEQKAQPALLLALYFFAEKYEELFYDIETFEHLYESKVKLEAEKAFKTGPMAVFLETIQRFHKGDEPEIKLMILAEFAAHVYNGQSVPVFIKGSSDGGKSSLNNAVHRIIPKRFVRKFTTLSQKSAYYNTTIFRNDYNKLVVNDILDSSDIMGFLKSWADNEEDIMRHTTVIKAEGAILEVKGRRGISITAADQIHDKQLNRRFLHLNPHEDEGHIQNTKKFIKESMIIGETNENDTYLRICQAIYDRIIETPYSVYNPFIDGLNQGGFSNTELKHIVNIIKAQTLINQSKRVEFADRWLLGTEDDVTSVLELWQDIKILQDTYLPQKAFDILKVIPEWDEDSEKVKKTISISGIVKATGTPKQTVRDFLFGVNDRLGLIDREMVKAVKADSNNPKSKWLLYRPVTPFDHNGDNESINREKYYTKIDEKSVVKSFWNITRGKVDENIHPAIIDLGSYKEVKTSESAFEVIKNAQVILEALGIGTKLCFKEDQNELF